MIGNYLFPRSEITPSEVSVVAVVVVYIPVIIHSVHVVVLPVWLMEDDGGMGMGTGVILVPWPRNIAGIPDIDKTGVSYKSLELIIMKDQVPDPFYLSKEIIVDRNAPGLDDAPIVIIEYRNMGNLDHCSIVIILDVAVIVTAHIEAEVASGINPEALVGVVSGTEEKIELSIGKDREFDASFIENKGFAIPPVPFDTGHQCGRQEKNGDKYIAFFHLRCINRAGHSAYSI